MGGFDFRLPLKLCNLSFLDAMERAHAGVVLYPDVNDSKLRVDLAACGSSVRPHGASQCTRNGGNGEALLLQGIRTPQITSARLLDSL
jgi:hypothetical protein